MAPAAYLISAIWTRLFVLSIIIIDTLLAKLVKTLLYFVRVFVDLGAETTDQLLLELIKQVHSYIFVALRFIVRVLLRVARALHKVIIIFIF